MRRYVERMDEKMIRKKKKKIAAEQGHNKKVIQSKFHGFKFERMVD